ncbi:hypothetical protein SAMN05216302_100545 [Nitrosomonas aestuarii]|uniref:Uncharacterized protein n=1 Tax=Nitrosomonas aestuarii TaxID=52441 RepID=A0A1I3Z232_9PROT|nr:hypothetical protein [Nitrosomonas aestuarii]SFK38047.1 hypothetical protein SAMN05216302_100545 [Nitrosomonas aestuarii]
MKYGKTSGVIAIFTVSVLMTSGASFAKGDTVAKENLRQNAVGIATSSNGMQNIKNKLIKLQRDSQSFFPIDNIANKYKNKLGAK